MHRLLIALLLLLFVAPVALADAPATAPDVAIDLAVDVTDEAAPVEEVSLEELFAELNAKKGAEEKLICWPPGTCTYTDECDITAYPASCDGGGYRYCDNPAGKLCAGTCVCRW